MSQNITSTRCCKIGGLRNYQRGRNFKEGEVNFERGGSNPLGNYGTNYIHRNFFPDMCSYHLCFAVSDLFIPNHCERANQETVYSSFSFQIFDLQLYELPSGIYIIDMKCITIWITQNIIVVI